MTRDQIKERIRFLEETFGDWLEPAVARVEFLRAGALRRELNALNQALARNDNSRFEKQTKGTVT